MKYIRTKDGIIPALKIDEHHFQGTKQGEKIPDWSVKQADTIEELCDEFVGLLNKNIDEPQYNTFLRIGDKLWFDDLEDCQNNKEWCSEIYGAIWTDKGLIYVAKMNDKGELELL